MTSAVTAPFVQFLISSPDTFSAQNIQISRIARFSPAVLYSNDSRSATETCSQRQKMQTHQKPETNFGQNLIRKSHFGEREAKLFRWRILLSWSKINFCFHGLELQLIRREINVRIRRSFEWKLIEC